MPSYNSFPQFPVLTGPRTGFPTGIKWPITKTPMWKTTSSESSSGKEYRYPSQLNPRWKFKIDFGYLFDDVTVPNAVYQNMALALQGFFNQQQGSYLPFLYTDPWDNFITNWTFAIGDGTTTAFQITRGLGNAGLSMVGTEYVQWSQAVPTIDFYINGVHVNPLNWSITKPPAIITFTSPPALNAPISWSGGYAYLCRFTQDKFDFVHEGQGWWTTNLEFESVLA